MTWYRWRWGRLAKADNGHTTYEDGERYRFPPAAQIVQNGVTWKHIGLGFYWATAN